MDAFPAQDPTRLELVACERRVRRIECVLRADHPGKAPSKLIEAMGEAKFILLTSGGERMLVARNPEVGRGPGSKNRIVGRSEIVPILRIKNLAPWTN